jgi:hypothetical protein
MPRRLNRVELGPAAAAESFARFDNEAGKPRQARVDGRWQIQVQGRAVVARAARLPKETSP